jgi:hypothetical protein
MIAPQLLYTCMKCAAGFTRLLPTLIPFCGGTR